MSTVDKTAMVEYVRSLGFDPNAVAGMSIDAERTTATLRSRPTDHYTAIDFLERQGISINDVVRFRLWHDTLIVTRHSRDKYGDVEFAVDVATPAVKFKEVYEEYAIV